MSKLILTIGLPRSGKSTWTEKQSHPIVSRDSIRLAFHGERYNQDLEDWVTRIQMVMIDALFLSGHETIILDETFMQQKYIDTWLESEHDVEFKYFTTHPDLCKKRAVMTDQDDLLPVIDNMFSKCNVQPWLELYMERHENWPIELTVDQIFGML